MDWMWAVGMAQKMAGMTEDLLVASTVESKAQKMVVNWANNLDRKRVNKWALKVLKTVENSECGMADLMAVDLAVGLAEKSVVDLAVQLAVVMVSDLADH